MNCPKCNIEMGYTHEPYERRCNTCGYWFDTYTGKELDPAATAEKIIRTQMRRARRAGYVIRAVKAYHIGILKEWLHREIRKQVEWEVWHTS